jgi:hypothetical protein
MNDRLHRGATTRLSLENTLLLRLVFIILEDNSERQEHEGRDYTEDSISPAPAEFRVNGVCSERPRKCSADERSLHKSERERSVPETGCIGDKHIQNQVQAVVADPVEHVTCSVSIRTIARGQNDHTK